MWTLTFSGGLTIASWYLSLCEMAGTAAKGPYELGWLFMAATMLDYIENTNPVSKTEAQFFLSVDAFVIALTTWITFRFLPGIREWKTELAYLDA